MKITCQSCQSKYNVADEKVQGKIVKIRCRKCGATIVVQGNGGAATNGSGTASRGPAPPPAFSGDDVQWHVNLGGETDPRTMSVRELIDSYNTGGITQDTFIWTDGMDDWKPLSEVEAVVAALHADAAGGEAAPASGYEVGPSSMHVEPPAPAPQEPAYQASEAVAPGYEAPTAIASFAMQAEVEAPVEPKRAAVKARGRDLFASRVASEDVQTSAPAASHMASGGMSGALDDGASKRTGERNENSVLFSLAVLTKEADRTSDEGRPAARPGATSEDSGLIDLKALAAKADSMRPAAMADNGVFAPPLGIAAAPLGAPMGALLGGIGDERPKSMLPLIIGGGAGAAVLAVLCVFVGMKLAGPSSAAAAASASAAAVAPPVASTAEAPSASAAPAAPEASATASAAPAKPKPAAATYHAPAPGAVAAKPAGATAAAAAPAAAAPPPKKAGSDCGCNGDLMCLMKCSTH